MKVFLRENIILSLLSLRLVQYKVIYLWIINLLPLNVSKLLKFNAKDTEW